MVKLIKLKAKKSDPQVAFFYACNQDVAICLRSDPKKVGESLPTEIA